MSSKRWNLSALAFLIYSTTQVNLKQELWPGKWTDKNLRLLLRTRRCKSHSKQSNSPHHIRGAFFPPTRACQSSVNIWPPWPLGLFRGTIFFRSQRFACVHCQLRRVVLFPISNAGTQIKSLSGRDLKTMYWPIKFSLCYQGKLTLHPQHVWICLLGIP